MRITPHLVVSTIALLLALAMFLPRLGGTGLDIKPFTEEPKVLLDEIVRPVIPADAVLRSLIAEAADITEINDPFLPPLPSASRVSSRLPPPPPFDLPEPQPLPLPEK